MRLLVIDRHQHRHDHSLFVEAIPAIAGGGTAVA